MALEIEGKLLQIFDERSGEGKNGHWSVRDFLIEIPGQYTREVAFSVWNNRIDLSTLQIGESLKVSFDASSRKGSTGQYFTSLTAWKIDKIDANGTTTQTSGASSTNTTQAGNTQPPIGPTEETSSDKEGDLPF